MRKREKKISIPAELYSRIADRAKNTGVGSIEEYVILTLEDTLKRSDEEPSLTKEEEDKIKKRLKDLGYLS